MFRKISAFILCLALMLPLCAVGAMAFEEADAATSATETQSASGGASGRMGGRSGMMGGMGGASSEGHYAEAAEKFEQFEYTDEETGLTIPYNLYLPEGYEKSKDEYPLVIFIADASVNSDEVTAVLTQDGATVWATEEEQEKHPCIVLVPQYTTTLISEIGLLTTDDNVWTDGLTLVKNLMDYVIDEYRVDENRIYGTGQSQGGMSTIAISDKYPDFYAAQFLVACQWDVEEMSAMVDDNLWIIVCEGDIKAYPGMNEATALWSELGAEVLTDDMWDSTSDAETFDALVAGMLEQDGSIRYNVFEGGSHMYTWTVAYTIEGIRDWLFEQSKEA